MSRISLTGPGLFVFSLLLLCLAAPPAGLSADTAADDLREILDRIDAKRLGWIALEAEVKLLFFVAGKQRAVCQGNLVYQRLEEKTFLECRNRQDELLFIFKTEDRHFELYVPERNTLFRGDIFAIEEGTEIESHLKPLDFYRALKPAALPRDRTILEHYTDRGWSLQVFGKRYDGSRYHARQVESDLDGNIIAETYFSLKEEPMLNILRGDYRSIRGAIEGKRRFITFPHQIIMQSEARDTKTVIHFEAVQTLTRIPEERWFFAWPAGTKVLTFPDPQRDN